MNEVQERLHILDRIERGEISAAEGLQLLAAYKTQNTTIPAEASLLGPTGEPEVVVIPPQAGPQDWDSPHHASTASRLPPDAEEWKRWWVVPFGAGIMVTVLSALLMNSLLIRSGLSFWFFLAMLPFLFGVLLIAIGWSSRTSRWLHVRIRQKPGVWPERIAISLPLPLGTAAWLLRTFRPYMTGLPSHMSVDQLLLALNYTASADTPLYIEVEGDEDGEHVEVYIG